MLAQGVKLQVVSEMVGHSSIRMTADAYGHVLAPDGRAAADAMDPRAVVKPAAPAPRQRPGVRRSARASRSRRP